MKSITKIYKEERERQILLGLVELYLREGKPIGSKTLQEDVFFGISSSTIRNYLSELEKEGYLKQQHTSGGRLPTDKAFRFYAKEAYDSNEISKEVKKQISLFGQKETRELSLLLHEGAELLSSLSNQAVFLSAPRFDHDFVVDIKLVPTNYQRFICVLFTDFGLVRTEIIHTEKRLNSFAIKRIENYFHWRLAGNDKPENMEAEEEKIAQEAYREIMVRYIVGYSNFTEEEIYRTGFSNLLTYPDFCKVEILASSLALFENSRSMRLFLKECSVKKSLQYWIGEDLLPFTAVPPYCTVIAAPYAINHQPVGAVGLLGPIRTPYRKLFGLLRAFNEALSTALTRNLYKFKIEFRQPQEGMTYLQQEEQRLIGQSQPILLENNR